MTEETWTEELFLEQQKSSEELEKLEINLLLQGIYEWCGYDFRNYTYNSIRRRIWHMVYAEKLESITDLLNKVLHEPDCLQRLIAGFTVNVTEMFRDPKFFLEFKEKVVPLLHTYPSIRIWHAGCSTGEEVYSMAILLHEAGLYEKAKIYATDINTDVLQMAKSGIFPMQYMKKYTNNYIQAGGERAFSEYYTVKGNGVRFHPYLIKNVVFAQHNLVTDQSFNEFHVILCRNVLIYFDKNLQNRVHDLFYESLAMFGFLGLGDKETIAFTPEEKSFEKMSNREKIYQKIK